MSAQRQEVDSVLLPLAEDRVLLPKVAVAEVYSLDAMSFRAEAPNWWLGFLPWHGHQVPVISFEALSGRELPAHTKRARVVVINSLGSYLETGLFAILAQGHPHLASLGGQAVQPDGEPSSAVELSRLRVGNTRPVIPDLEAIEFQIMDALKSQDPATE
jgi:chemosensory pili system protein ChpC